MKVEVRVKDTRAALVKHFDGKTWHFPGALFHPSRRKSGPTPRLGPATGSVAPQKPRVAQTGGDLEEGSAEPDSLEGPEPGDQPDDEPNHYAVAAE